MTPIQQMLLGAGAASKTYMDDLFSTHLYEGTGSNRTITNNIDVAGEGGLVWIKSRGNTEPHLLFDTERGVHKYLRANESDAETNLSASLTAFNNNGFNVSTANRINQDNIDFASWTFLKKPGFLDIVTYTGNGSTSRTISHNLGCMPGFIMFKNTSTNYTHWITWHRDYNDQHSYTQPYMRLNGDYAFTSLGDYGNDLTPTATTLNIPRHNNSGNTADSVNVDGDSYVAYVFAGGDSSAATARSVKDFDGSRYIQTGTAHADYAFGTGDFTVECWVKFAEEDEAVGIFSISPDGNNDLNSSDGQKIGVMYDETYWRMFGGNASGGSYKDSGTYYVTKGQWYHVAYVRSSGVTTLYVNGVAQCETNDTVNWSTNNKVLIGGASHTFYYHEGSISNFRVVKGTAVYTNSFIPPTVPLTNITNTKLLCCQNSTAAGTTVIASGYLAGDTTSVTATTDSPFDDPAGFIFGENEDTNAITCGEYIGTGNTGDKTVEIHTGWEPQWVLVKRTLGGGGCWNIVDSMRGAHSGNDYILKADTNTVNDRFEALDITPTGFKVTTTGGFWNSNGDEYIYVAIRKPDGYIGKPADTGTKVFTTSTRTGGPPGHPADFDVDMAIYRQPAYSHNWGLTSRIMGVSDERTRLYTNTAAGEVGAAAYQYDYSNGWNTASGSDTSYQAWMWKRHAGFDVGIWTGDGKTNRAIRHNLGKAPEMMWIKNRDQSGYYWRVYHKDFHDTSPWNYGAVLNSNAANTYHGSGMFGTQAPSAVDFRVGRSAGWDGTNKVNLKYFGALFASVDKISKVGSFTGNGSTQTITTGFQPRFLILKSFNTGDWFVLDTVRGWGSGNDKKIQLNENTAQADNDMGAPTSTGFSLTSGSNWNGDGTKYLYYAHA